jgi:hypothetical protein
MNLSLAICLGVARAMTFGVWTGPGGEALVRGTALTLVLWLATIGVGMVASVAEVRLGWTTMPPSTAETLISAAATIATQVLVVYLRSQDKQLATS